MKAPVTSLTFLFVLLLTVVFIPPTHAASSDFPLPDNLRPAVRFWTRVYTEVDTQSGFLHDSVNLDVVYDALPRDTKLIDERRKAIIADLNVLAAGKREGLSTSQSRILELWGASTSNQRFREATETVRWQLGQSDRYREGLIRSGAYRAHIERVAGSMGLPLELAVLPHVESSFHPGAVSSAAATGMWQFVRETARRFMRVDTLVDERLDPYQATYGALLLLQDNYRVLGNWPLALTAYNHGTNGMKRAVTEAGTSDIGRIVAEYKGPRFGFASRNFYAQFLAAMAVEQDAERYFGPLTLADSVEFSQVELTGYIDIETLSRNLGVGLDSLKRDNPALLPAVWSGNKRVPKGYTLKLDRRHYAGDLTTDINAIAAAAFYAEQIPDVSYVVQSGDSLSVIASRFKTSVAELVAINQLSNRNQLRIGQTLVLPQNGNVPTVVVNRTQPAPAPGQYAVVSGDTLSTIATRFGTSTRSLMALNGLNEKSILRPGQLLVLGEGGALHDGGRYAVRRGDTLSTIARQFRTTPQQLLALNNLEDGNLIFPGQELVVAQAFSSP